VIRARAQKKIPTKHKKMHTCWCILCHVYLWQTLTVWKGEHAMERTPKITLFHFFMQQVPQLHLGKWSASKKGKRTMSPLAAMPPTTALKVNTHPGKTPWQVSTITHFLLREGDFTWGRTQGRCRRPCFPAFVAVGSLEILKAMRTRNWKWGD
jgi:hypothetical protein